MVLKNKKRRSSNPSYCAKLTSRYQIIVPKEVREHLRLKIGDEVWYEVQEDNTVNVRKTAPLDLDYLQALNSTLNEWESDEDAKAYKNL